jgi:4a-hydroxytetrahydrobiopterin dehydratase
MTALSDKKCGACTGEVPKLEPGQIEELLPHLQKGWSVEQGHHLFRKYDFEDFKNALDYVNQLGELAEDEGHHPDLLLAWGKVEVSIFTHKVDGLTEADFILAAKIDRLNRA